MTLFLLWIRRLPAFVSPIRVSAHSRLALPCLAARYQTRFQRFSSAFTPRWGLECAGEEEEEEEGEEEEEEERKKWGNFFFFETVPGFSS